MNLYTQLIERETTHFQRRIDHINGQLHSILRAERFKERLIEAGVLAGVHANEQCYPYLEIEAPVEVVAAGALADRITQAIGRRICPDQDKTRHGDAYLILPNDDEERWTSLPLVISAY